eukprot:scaffold10.g2241.t1
MANPVADQRSPLTQPAVEEGVDGASDDEVQAPAPTLYQRFKGAVKALQRQVLALNYAMQDPEYVIPVLGLVDDLIILPVFIYVAVKLIPQHVWERARVRADTEPVRLSSNWAMAVFFFLLWDALVVWAVHWAVRHWGSADLQQRWMLPIVAGTAAVLVLAEGAWAALHLRRKRRERAEQLLQAAADGSLEEQLLIAQDGRSPDDP